MTKMLRSQIVLAAAVSLAGAMCFAQDGAATYKAKCAMCHGATGTPSVQEIGQAGTESPRVGRVVICTHAGARPAGDGGACPARHR